MTAELHWKDLFSDYVFLVHSVIQKLNISNQTNIATRRVTSTQLTAGMPSSNFNRIPPGDKPFGIFYLLWISPDRVVQTAEFFNGFS